MNHYALYNASMLIDLDVSTQCGSCNDKERMYLYILYLSVKHNIFLGIKWRVKKISLERKGVRQMKKFSSSKSKSFLLMSHSIYLGLCNFVVSLV